MSIFNATAPSGGGGEIETGVFTPTSNIWKPTINFTNSHTTLPIFAAIQLDVGVETTQRTAHLVVFNLWEQLTGHSLIPGTSSSSTGSYGLVQYWYRNTSSTSLSSSTVNLTISGSDTSSTSDQAPRVWVTNAVFTPHIPTGNNYYFRSGKNYKWIAIWAPEN